MRKRVQIRDIQAFCREKETADLPFISFEDEIYYTMRAVERFEGQARDKPIRSLTSSEAPRSPYRSLIRRFNENERKPLFPDDLDLGEVDFPDASVEEEAARVLEITMRVWESDVTPRKAEDYVRPLEIISPKIQNPVGYVGYILFFPLLLPVALVLTLITVIGNSLDALVDVFDKDDLLGENTVNIVLDSPGLSRFDVDFKANREGADYDVAYSVSFRPA
jgi:hypothetical protein